MEKLSEEERERIEKESKTFSEKQGVGYPVSMDYRMMIVSQIKDAYKSGATSECLKKNEEINKLKEWYEEKEIEISAERISIAVGDAEEQLRKELEINQQEFQARNSELSNDLYRKLQASEQRVKELENQWSNHRINYTCSGRNSEF